MSEVADQLDVDAVRIWTVIHVETCGCGFLSDRRPNILFERPHFPSADEWPPRCGSARPQQRQVLQAMALRAPTCSHPPIFAAAGGPDTAKPACMIDADTEIDVETNSATNEMTKTAAAPCIYGHCASIHSALANIKGHEDTEKRTIQKGKAYAARIANYNKSTKSLKYDLYLVRLDTIRVRLNKQAERI